MWVHLMSKKEEIVKLRIENPLMTGVKIGKQVGVVNSYVFKVLTNAGLHTAPPRKKTLPRQCTNCHTPIESRRRFCSRNCKVEYVWVTVKCTFCRAVFTRKRSLLEQGSRMEYNNLYCSNTCFQKRNT